MLGRSPREISGKQLWGQGMGLARKKFQGSVGAEMDHGIGMVLDVKIGAQPVVGRRKIGVMEDAADLAVAFGAVAAPFGLDDEGQLAKGESCNHKDLFPISLVDHALAGKRVPVLVHPVPGKWGQDVKMFSVGGFHP